MTDPYAKLPADWDAIGRALRSGALRETHELLEEVVRYLANGVLEGKVTITHNRHERVIRIKGTDLEEVYKAGMCGIDDAFASYRATLPPGPFVVRAVLSGIERHCADDAHALPPPKPLEKSNRSNGSKPRDLAIWNDDPVLEYLEELMGNTPLEALAADVFRDLGYAKPESAYTHLRSGMPNALRRARSGKMHASLYQTVRREFEACFAARATSADQLAHATRLLDDAFVKYLPAQH